MPATWTASQRPTHLVRQQVYVQLVGFGVILRHVQPSERAGQVAIPLEIVETLLEQTQIADVSIALNRLTYSGTSSSSPSSLGPVRRSGAGLATAPSRFRPLRSACSGLFSNRITLRGTALNDRGSSFALPVRGVLDIWRLLYCHELIREHQTDLRGRWLTRIILIAHGRRSPALRDSRNRDEQM